MRPIVGPRLLTKKRNVEFERRREAERRRVALEEEMSKSVPSVPLDMVSPGDVSCGARPDLLWVRR